MEAKKLLKKLFKIEFRAGVMKSVDFSNKKGNPNATLENISVDITNLMKEIRDQSSLDIQKEFAFIDEYFNKLTPERLISDLWDCGLRETEQSSDNKLTSLIEEFENMTVEEYKVLHEQAIRTPGPNGEPPMIEKINRRNSFISDLKIIVAQISNTSPISGHHDDNDHYYCECAYCKEWSRGYPTDVVHKKDCAYIIAKTIMEKYENIF